MQYQTQTVRSVRRAVGVLAAVLALHAIWLFTIELIRPGLSYFPVTAADARTVADYQFRAGIAAQLGRLRGDLWTDLAITESARTGFSDAASDATVAAAHAKDATAAAIWAPSDPRGWLLLAATAPRSDLAVLPAETAWLKMSYFTGPNALSLMPMRLGLVVRSRAFSDPELQEFARGDIRAIIDHAPSLQSALIEAYRSARPEAQQRIKAMIKDAKPALLKEIDHPRP